MDILILHSFPTRRSSDLITYTPALQRTRGATETMYLMARHVFEDLGYRRYEWKCNALNEKSRRAALRFGFAFEGVFRDRKSTRLNSSHMSISYAVFCLKK